MKFDKTLAFGLGGGIVAAATAFWLGWALGSQKQTQGATTSDDSQKTLPTSTVKETQTTESKKPTPGSTRVLAISMGGTSCRFAICERKKDQDGQITIDIIKKEVVKTEDPKKLIEDLTNFTTNEVVSEVGIASFGPICLDKTSEYYGNILPTPKGLFNNFPLLNQVQTLAAQKNAFIDTDVNAAALAEFRRGNASYQLLN